MCVEIYFAREEPKRIQRGWDKVPLDDRCMEDTMAKILVVEDERPIRDLLNMSLTGAGYECTLASDGLQAVNILEENYFDLVLLDIMLPEINGYEVFEYVKPLNIPVIFLQEEQF